MISNIKKFEIKHCKYCGARFPEDSLNDINDDINIIVCESCGTENKIESFEIQDDKKKERNSVKKGKSDKNRIDSSSKKEFNRQIRLHVFRTIYEMLKDPEYNFDIKENQNELTEFQLNRLANTLRKKVLELEIQEEWLNNLYVIKRLDFKEYYDNLHFILSSKRQFKEIFLRDFQKAIEFVFELIKGKLMISELETEKGQEYKFIKNKKEIAEDLIKKFGFLEDMKQRGNFEIFLAVFISRYIYDTIKDPKFESVMGAYKGELMPSQIDKLALSLKSVISCQYIKDEWFENFSRLRKRSFLKNYQRLQKDILTDHLYSVTFLDYLKYLIRLVDGLINGKNVDLELKKNELIIARDLRCGDPFQSIGASNPLFKPNLLIVLGRIAYLIAKTMESDRESNEDQANRLEPDTDKILNQIMPEIATRNKINDELLKKLYKISKEDFQKDYAKLKSNIKSDQICYAQVSFYLKWVIETILNILSGAISASKFSMIEKAIVRDLKNYSFDKLIDSQKEGADDKTVNLRIGKSGILVKELIREIKSKKGIYNLDYNYRLDEIAEKQQLTIKNFFRLIKVGVEDILGVKTNYRELSKDYLTYKWENGKKKGNKWYVNDRIIQSLRFTNGYALSTASLNKMKRNLVEAFKEKSAYFKYLIEMYKSINPWSHKFSKQPTIITDYFKKIDTLEKAYWFGFLLAEAHFNIRGKSKAFSMDLSALDLDHLIEFCKVIGFDYRKLRYGRAVGSHGQTLRHFSIKFTNTKFCDNLVENGFPKDGLTSKNPDLRFPYWIFSDKRFAMAMLLGFFDGDGSHGIEFSNKRKSDDIKLVPSIGIKNKQCLEDIKECFNIEDEIKNRQHRGYVLTFSKDLFNNLLLNYRESLKRKQHVYTIKDSNYRCGISKKLLKEGWSLEEIYSREFGYLYRKEDHHAKPQLFEHFKEWFANDSAVKDSNGEVSLRNIVEAYGKLENNPLVMTDREIVILKRKEGWSVEKIYTKELDYKDDPNASNLRYRMTQKLKAIFKDDPLIIGHKDIIKRIEEIYNPANKL